MLVTSRTAAREPTSRRYNTHEIQGLIGELDGPPSAQQRAIPGAGIRPQRSTSTSKNMSRVMILVLTGRWITRRKGDSPIAGLEGPHHRHPAIRTLATAVS